MGVRQYRFVLVTFLLAVSIPFNLRADNGYELWLRYHKINDTVLVKKYCALIPSYHVDFISATGNIIQQEISRGLSGLLGFSPKQTGAEAALVVTTIKSDLARTIGSSAAETPSGDGYTIKTLVYKKQHQIVIVGASEVGALYGVFHFLKLLQTQQDISNLNVNESPRIERRILNHWDNLDRTIERGYAGISIWNWHTLPEIIEQRYHDYARANASIGINGTVLTNVNANALVLTNEYLVKVKALADVFRPYGIKVYLTARFNAPIELHALETADPLNPKVAQWWKNKAGEIYKLIPDFGGFLVKANSEGQPGPQSYNRTHAEGANMLASALEPFGGIVMWRAFVYDNNDKTDRAKQAFNEFKPLDGQFAANVILQVKNGPIDFQPREPFHPLFGAMPKTAVMPEFQITEEYLGFATHLVFLAPLFKECLDADTYAHGPGSTVAKVIDGSLNTSPLSAIAGVSNIGNDMNWCGHPFAQANWFAFGRLAWNHQLTSESLAREWASMTFGNNQEVVNTVTEIMLASREAAVNYMTPLGLHHIMGWDHHYGPAPWIANKPRADWTSVYYHKADTLGIGFDRTANGSNALELYAPEVRKKFEPVSSCPEEYLLWFHHVSWNHKMHSGKPLWDELCWRYHQGTIAVEKMRLQWNKVQGKIDDARFMHVSDLLEKQYKESIWWRNACLLYFQQFARKPFPKDFPQPDKTLEFYQSLEFPYAPGIKPKW